MVLAQGHLRTALSCLILSYHYLITSTALLEHNPEGMLITIHLKGIASTRLQFNRLTTYLVNEPHLGKQLKLAIPTQCYLLDIT